MSEVSIIGLDIAKNVFHAHGADASGRAVFSRKIGRGKLLEFVKCKLEQKSEGKTTGLRPDETAVLALLKSRLAAQRKRNQPLPQLLERSLAMINKRRASTSLKVVNGRRSKA